MNDLSYDWEANAIGSYALAIPTLRQRYLEQRLPGESAEDWQARTGHDE